MTAMREAARNRARREGGRAPLRALVAFLAALAVNAVLLVALLALEAERGGASARRDREDLVLVAPDVSLEPEPRRRLEAAAAGASSPASAAVSRVGEMTQSEAREVDALRFETVDALSSALDLPLALPLDEPVRVARSSAEGAAAEATAAVAPAADGEGRSAAGPADVGARVLRQTGGPAPVYPPRERRRGIEGSVELELVIDASGRVTSVSVVELRGPEAFAEAAVRAARDWRFEAPGAAESGSGVRARRRVDFVLSGRDR